jgi:hypothetical protein
VGEGNGLQVSVTLRFLAGVNLDLGLIAEGIQQVEQSLEISKQLNDTYGQARLL